ncbi:MAG: hypothetical protein ACOCY1_04905 [Halovenus sp.]
MGCQVETRKRVRTVAERLGTDPRVEAVDVIQPSADPTDGWLLNIYLSRRQDTVPADVLTALGGHGLDIHDVMQQGPHKQVLAVLQR